MDVYHFSARKGGDFRITTNFASTFNYEITIYDANMSLVSQTAGSSAQVTLSRGEEAFVQVRSLAGEVDAFDLFFERIGGGTTGGGGQGGSKGGKGNGKGEIPRVPDEGRESFAQPQAAAEGVGPFAASRFTSIRGEQPVFNRLTGTAGHRWRSTDVVGSRQADWLGEVASGYTWLGDAHGADATRRAVSQMVPLADAAPFSDLFDAEATLDDLAGEWARVFDEV